MSITVGGGLGVRISGGIVVGPSVGVSLSGNDYVNFLLRDDFTTAEAAPLASPRTAEPGPGTLTLVQTDGQFSISDGKLNFPAQTTPANGDQGFTSGALARAAGRALLNSFSVSANSSGTDLSQWYSAASPLFANRVHGILIHGSAGLSLGVTEILATGYVYALNTDYELAVVLRGTGALYFIKGGLFTNWTLLWVSATSTTTPLYPGFANANAVGTLDTFRVRDLPAPFDTDYGLATDRLAGAVSAGTTFVHEANCVIEFTVTTRPNATKTINVNFRQQDYPNRWVVSVDSTGSIYLVEVVAGAATNRGTAAGAVSNGQRVVVVADGSTIRVYSNNVLGITYSSASNFATETDGEFDDLVDSTGGAISNLVSWPRTLSGAAANILDQSVA